MQRRSPACDVLGPKARVKDFELVQKNGWVVVRLTEGLWWPELLRRAAGDEVARRR